jgi:hypothetical protein
VRRLGVAMKRRNPFTQLEKRIMAAIDDAVARITADVDKLITALATASGTGTTDTANAAALSAASDRAEAALSPPPVPTPAPAPAPAPAATTDAPPESGALTAPA